MEPKVIAAMIKLALTTKNPEKALGEVIALLESGGPAGGKPKPPKPEDGEASEDTPAAPERTRAAIEAMLDANPSLTVAQRDFVRSMGHPADAQRALASYGSAAGAVRTKMPDGRSLHEAMGLRTTAYRAPFRREDGAWVQPLNTPTSVRARAARGGA